MSFTAEVMAKIREYLEAVRANLGARPDSVKAELLRQLESHICEALRKRGGETPSVADVEAVLGEMDPPEAFGKGKTEERKAEDGKVEPGGIGCGGPASGGGRPAGWMWFALALCFLLLNGWGIGKLTSLAAARGGADSALSAGDAAKIAAAVKKAGANAPLTAELLNRTNELSGQQCIVWRFSREMVPAEMVGKVLADGAPAPAVREEGNDEVDGSCVWNSTRDLQFVPSCEWAGGGESRKFSAELPEEFCSLDGKALTGRRAFQFRTPSLRLESALQTGRTEQGEPVLRLSFNLPPESKELEKYITVASGDGQRTIAWRRVGDMNSRDVIVWLAEEEPETGVVVTVKKGLPPAKRGAEFALAADSVKQVQVRNEFTVDKLEAQFPAFGEGNVDVSTGKALDLAAAESYITVEPAVAKLAVIPPESWCSGCRVSGGFAPGTSYTFTFKKGMPAADGSILAEEVVHTVVMPNRDSALDLAVDGSILSPDGALNVPVQAMNVKECHIELRKVLPENLVFFANGKGATNGYYYERNPFSRMTEPAVKRKAVFSGTPNKEQKLYVNLRELAGDEPRGVYQLAVSQKPDGDHDEYYDRGSRVTRLVMVTDLGLSVKSAKDGFLVWVNSLRNAQPAADVEVALHADNGRVLGRAKTDAQGLAFLPCAQDEKGPAELKPTLVTAARGADLSYVRLSGGGVSVDGSGGAAYLGAESEAFLFSDRGIYRPGETLHTAALVRDAALRPPVPFPVIFRVVKPDGKVFKDFPVTLDTRGSAEFAAELPAYLPTGRYGVKLVMPGTFKELGATAVSLEEFVPPQIAVELAKLPERVKAFEKLAAAVSARHLFGSPAAGLAASATLYVKDTPFKPKGWSGYQFGDDEKTEFSKSVKLGEVVLDKDGKCGFGSAAWAAGERLRPRGALKATVCATVRETSGRGVSAYGNAAVDAYPFYVGVKAERAGGSVKVGEALKLAVAAVKPDGGAVQPDSPLLATVERVEWTSVMKRSGGRYAWHSERVKTKVGEPQKVVLSDGAGDFSFTADATGEYLVTLADPFSGSSTSLTLFAATGDAGWVNWAKDKPAEAQLTFDREEYAPGEKAKLAVKAPFAGRALLTVETDRVLERRVVVLDGNTAEFEIDVKPEYAPNAHCVLSLIRPAVAESVWSAHRALGSAVLKVVPPGHRLDVSLELPTVIRPQSKLSVRVKATDEEGKDAPGTGVVVTAVDEGICDLTNFKLPEPLAHFWRLRGLGVALFDLYAELMPVSEDTADATASHTAGDIGALLGRRLTPIKANRFKPVALWKSGAVTDANGEAVVEFDVPEFTGELRVTAVAFADSAFGSAKRQVTVKRPLVVQANLPRFLAPGDSCRMGLAVFNEMGSDQDVKWRVTCGGPLSVEVAEGTLALKKGASGRVPVTLKAGALPGRALCTVEAVAGAEKYTETFELAVRPVAQAESRLLSAAVKPGEEARIAMPSEWLAGTEFYEAWVSPLPDVKLTGGLDRLLRYPYGCCEQTTSAAFPLLYLGDLITRTKPQALGERPDTARFVMAGVWRLLTMQRESGGFAMWPDSREVEPWVSIYAAHFLVEAKKAGQPVPEDRLDAALGYLRGRLERSGTEAPTMEECAYICQVLALAGKPDAGWTARLLEKADKLQAEGRARLAAALLASGKPREAVKLLGGMGMPEAAGDRDHWSASRTRDIALALSAWLDVEPGNEMVPRLVRGLEGTRVRDCGWWGSTQENAVALMALGKFARLAAPDKTPFAGELVPAGAAAVPFASAKDLRWSSKEPGAVKELRIVNRGPGTCWYGVRMEGVPSMGTVKTEDAGVAVRRTFLDMDGKPLDVKKLKQGELAVVRLAVDTRGESLNNLVVEDLLPAGWEVENPALATAQTPKWLEAKSDWCIHRELRDDRVLLFTGAVAGEVEFYYTVRAVTPGVFVLPPVRVEGMYRSDVRSASGGGTVEVAE